MSLERIRRQQTLALVALVSACLLVPGCKPPPRSGGPRQPANYFKHVILPPGGDADSSLIVEIKQAESLRLQPYAFLTTSDCEPCQAIKDAWHDPRMQAAMNGTYIIELQIEQWEKLPTDVEARAIPEFIELDYFGRPTGAKMTGSAWETYTPEDMAPKMTAFFQRKSRPGAFAQKLPPTAAEENELLESVEPELKELLSEPARPEAADE